MGTMAKKKRVIATKKTKPSYKVRGMSQTTSTGKKKIIKVAKKNVKGRGITIKTSKKY